jgi:hypothetical protein
MTYTQTNLATLRSKAGSLLQKLYTEFGLVKTELDTLTTANGKAAINTVDLTASMVSATSLAANGADLASGTNATYYAVWCVPVDIHVVSMDDFLTEAYVKETTDAKIEIVTEAGSPVTIATRTLTAGGEAVKTKHSTTPAVTAVTAGTILNLKITASASSTGTGHAKVFMRYTVD